MILFIDLLRSEATPPMVLIRIVTNAIVNSFALDVLVICAGP